MRARLSIGLAAVLALQGCETFQWSGHHVHQDFGSGQTHHSWSQDPSLELGREPEPRALEMPPPGKTPAEEPTDAP